MASGDILDRLFPPGEAPASNYATFDTRNQHPVLDFDDTTDESAVWTSVIPPNYAGGGLTVRLYWSATSATSGNVVWAVAFERIDADTLDTDADSFASAQSVTVATSGTSGKVEYSDVSFTDGAQMDSIDASQREQFRIKVSRTASSGSDTMAGDAELHAVTIRET